MPGAGRVCFDEDLSVETGDGDVVPVNDEQYLFEEVLPADHVGDSVEREGAVGAQLPQVGAGREVSWRCRLQVLIGGQDDERLVWSGTRSFGLLGRLPRCAGTTVTDVLRDDRSPVGITRLVEEAQERALL